MSEVLRMLSDPCDECGEPILPGQFYDDYRGRLAHVKCSDGCPNGCDEGWLYCPGCAPVDGQDCCGFPLRCAWTGHSNASDK